MKKQPQAPMNQHHTTDAGPPRSMGVSKVVETEEHTPLADAQRCDVIRAGTIEAKGKRAA